MGYRDDVNAFLQDKRNRAFGIIKSTSTLHDLNEARTSLAKAQATIESPSLDIDSRIARGFKETPTYQPDSVMVEMGKAYEGVEVTIPVKGDTTLFTTFIGNRSICNGFSVAGKAIKIKQYDFSGTGIDGVKKQIKSCVESLQNSLNELKEAVFSHHNDLDIGVEDAVGRRRNDFASQERRDKDADPWG